MARVGFNKFITILPMFTQDKFPQSWNWDPSAWQGTAHRTVKREKREFTAINTSKPHCTFLLTPRKGDIRPAGVVGTERSSWHPVWRRDLGKWHRVKEGTWGEGRRQKFLTCRPYLTRSLFAQDRKTLSWWSLLRHSVISHPSCYIPIWRKSKKFLKSFFSGSQLCNSVSPTAETLGSFLTCPRYLVDNLKDKEVSEIFDEFKHFYKSI